MLHGLSGWHLVILLVVVLLLFGAAKLPALAKSVGQSARVLKGEMKAMKAEDAVAAPAEANGVERAQVSVEPADTARAGS